MNKFSFIDIKKQGLLLYEYIRGSNHYMFMTSTYYVNHSTLKDGA